MEEKIYIETITWTSPEYEHKSRSNDWIWTIGVVSIIGAVLAFWFKTPLFGIFIILSAGVLIMLSIRQPKEIQYEINSDGIKAEHAFYPYNKIKGYTIKSGSPNAKLLIEIKKYFLPLHTIPLPEEIAHQADDSLRKFIPVLELNETQLIQFAEKIGL